MSKTLLLLSLTALTILGIGTSIFPHNPVFWLASSATDFQIVRIILSVILVSQLTTSPPRNFFFRIIAGLLSVLIGTWSIQQSYAYHMNLLDTLAFMAASLAVLITALERRVIGLHSEPLLRTKNALI